MKRAVCPNPEIDACSLDELPDDYAPLDPKSECSICQAVTADGNYEMGMPFFSPNTPYRVWKDRAPRYSRFKAVSTRNLHH